mgnify:CR=1 FL=1
MFTEDHVGAYAAQSAYFFMLCMIPIILLFDYHGAVYPGNQGGCHDRRDSGVSYIRGFYDYFDCEPGVQPIFR